MSFSLREFNRLSEQSELFDEMYCNNQASNAELEPEVLEAHEAIIQGYQALIAGLSQSKKKEKADVYNNMHVQYEGLRKYYGICFDKTPKEAKADKRELLEKQCTCNAQCIFYATSSRDTYPTKSAKTFEAEYLAEYEVVKKRLSAARKILDNSNSSSSLNLYMDTSGEVDCDDEALPVLVRKVSKHTEAGIESLMSLRQNSTSSEDDSECVSEEGHSECVSTLLAFATPRTCSPQKSLELINQCWRDLHLLSQSAIFEHHPQRVNIMASVQLLATVKISLEGEKSQNNPTPSLSIQGFMAPSRTVGVKRTSRDEQQEEIDTRPTQASSCSSSYN
jgi:hypothetical protein|tara:strand:+ start:34725 stop:35729 length:1005 start_codon:yes stop_codon:yes gene_type:complete